MFQTNSKRMIKKLLKINFLIGFSSFHSLGVVHASDASNTSRIITPPPTPVVATAAPQNTLVAPPRVYHASFTVPTSAFIFGLERGRRAGNLPRSEDLSEHLYQRLAYPFRTTREDSYYQRENPSAFITTSSSRDYVLSLLREIARANTQNFRIPAPPIFIYEIVPQNNFVSIADTYYRALDEERNRARSPHFLPNSNLRDLRAFYTEGNEYAALYRIPSDAIHLARMFRFDERLGDYVEFVEGMEFNSNFRARPPVVHDNNFPIGNVPQFERIRALANANIICNVPRASGNSSRPAPMKKKREVEEYQFICPPQQEIKQERIELPKEIFEKQAFQIQVKTQNSKPYCLVPYDKYLYMDNCNIEYDNTKWLYTEFGQLIGEIKDNAGNKQYYCLTAPKSFETDNILKMKICDLTNYDQHWNFKKMNGTNVSLVSHSGKNVMVDSYYGYLDRNSNEDNVTDQTLNILNLEEIKRNTSAPLIQFEVSVVFTETSKIPLSELFYAHLNLFGYAFNDGNSLFFSEFPYQEKLLTIYPSENGYAYSDEPNNVNKYRNYYNAQNNAFFSNYGTTGRQVCYYSILNERGGTDWDRVGRRDCSTQAQVYNSSKWFFQKSDDGKNYHITDSGNNLLRNNGDRSYFYTTHVGWTDSDTSFLQNFNLSPVATMYADYYSAMMKDLQKKEGVQKLDDNNEKSAIFAYDSLYRYFSKVYPIK